MPIPFLIPLLMAAGGAGLGALKGATDDKKGNLLSSMLIGGGLGAAGGFAAPMFGSLMGLSGGTASAAGALPQVAKAATSTAAGLTPATSSALSSMMSAGNPVVAGAGFNLPTVGASAAKAAPSMFSRLGSFANSPAGKVMFKSIGQSQPQQEIPDYMADYGVPMAQNVPYMMPQNQYIGKQASLPQIPQRRFA